MRIPRPWRSKAWALLRADLRRRWPLKAWLKLLAALAGVLAVQALYTWWVLHAERGGPGVSAMVVRLGSYAGVTSQLWAGLIRLAEGISAEDARQLAARRSLDTVLMITAVPQAALHLLMPLYAAAALAQDRERKSIADAARSGVSPTGIFVAKGAAALFPFAVLAIIGTLAALTGYLATYAATPPDPVVGRLNRRALPEALLLPVWFFSRAGVLLGLSALFPRWIGAVVAGYLIAGLVLPSVGQTVVWEMGMLSAMRGHPWLVMLWPWLVAAAGVVPVGIWWLGQTTAAEVNAAALREPPPGAPIAVVAPGSAAETAGLRPGDRVVAVDGAPVADANDLRRALLDAGRGQAVSLRVVRGSETVTLALRTPGNTGE